MKFRHLAAVAAFLMLAPVVSASAETSVRLPTLGVSLTTDGAFAGASRRVAMSADGRYVVFVSGSAWLPGDGEQVYRRDMLTGTTRLVSANALGHAGNAPADADVLAISGNGRYVAYLSHATNVLPTTGPVNIPKLFVRDLGSKTSYVVNAHPGGKVFSLYGPGLFDLRLSTDGRYLAFTAEAGQVEGGDSTRVNVYRWDRTTAQSTLVSQRSAADANTQFGENALAMSGDGRYVAYGSRPYDPETGSYLTPHVYVRDLALGRTRLVDRTPSGVVSSGAGGQLAMSTDGRYLVFSGHADNVTSGPAGLLLRDLVVGKTRSVGVAVPEPGNPNGGRNPAVSDDGRYVAFVAEPVPYGTEGEPSSWYYPAQVYVRDLTSRSVRRVTSEPDGSPIGRFDWRAEVLNLAMSADGRYVAFGTSGHVIDGGWWVESVDDAQVYRVGPVH